MYMLEPDGDVVSAEVRGFVRQAEGEGAKANYLYLRDEKVGDVQSLPQVSADQITDQSPWGGLSGALVFYEGRVLGHVVQHRPHLGNNPLVVVPIERVAGATGERARHIATLLGLSAVNDLPWATGAVEELAGLVDLLGPNGDLPLVKNLTPYQLGADPSEYGDTESHGHHDPYLARTADHVDERLSEALADPKRLVILVGPSKAGKTRTAFQGLRTEWPHAHLAKPDPARLADLLEHPRISATDWPLVLWLDDLQRYLVGDKALTPARLAALFTRQGPTVVLATLRQEERARLNEHADLTPGTRQLLNDAAPATITLRPTSADPFEQAAAHIAYPDVDLNRYGLAEQLAGAPELLRQYTDALPPLRAVLETAIDWQRIGMPHPIGEPDLKVLARRRLIGMVSYMNPSDEELLAAIEQARTPPKDPDGRTTGQLAALDVQRPTESAWHYVPYPYLVAHDDGQGGHSRAISDDFWRQGLALADADSADGVGSAAYYRGRSDVAREALTIAAVAGNDHSMRNLGWLFANETDPPDFDAAQKWLKKAAALGNNSAMRTMGIILSTKLDPPDLDGAQEWYREAIDSGNTDAMRNLGILLANRLDPPDLDGAQEWYRKAIDTGNTDAMVNLGALLSRLGDRAGTEGAWHRALDAQNVFPENTCLAAFGLAALAAFDADFEQARALLELATASGAAIAVQCADILSADGTTRDLARQLLVAREDDTDALNFLGLSARSSGQLAAGIAFWTKSAAAGDSVAPLLLHLAAPTSDPRQ
ncbi:hypothetical protein ACGFIF_44110 [Kribbella sp. NPDC049174]|uniref:SEL1-like repeat protein n=1 Tax=Kribbella sp. NPDC049174 TaxID=3364112 RepID=UPI00371B854B